MADWYATEEGQAWLAQCQADSDAETAFIVSHSREEVADRLRAARSNPRWKRWWEPEPEPPRRWNPPFKVRREVAERYGAREGTTQVVCRCGAAGEIRWHRYKIRFVGLHLDHVQPRSRGGADKASNLQLLCPLCNWRKGNRWVA